jgi:elongation factor Tu
MTPTAADGPFLMRIVDVFSITGRGTVVTGRIERGKIRVGEEVEIVGPDRARKAVVSGVEMIKYRVDTEHKPGLVGLLLRDIGKNEVGPGMVLAKPGTVARDANGALILDE